MVRMFVTHMTTDDKPSALKLAKKLFKDKGYTRLGFKPELKFLGRKAGFSSYELYRVKMQ